MYCKFLTYKNNGGVVFYYGFKAWLLLLFCIHVQGLFYCIKLLMAHEFCIS